MSRVDDSGDRARRFKFDDAVLRHNWALLWLPLLSALWVSPELQMGGYAVLTALALRGPIINRFDAARLLPMLLFAFVALITVSRGAPISATVFVLALFPIVLLTAQRATPHVAIRSLVSGVAIYLVGNVLGWMAGIPAQASGVRIAGFETSSPIFGERILFPFARSIVEPSIMACAFLAFVIVARKGLWRLSPLATQVGGVAAIFVVIGSNGRVPLIALTAVIVSRWIPKLAPRVGMFSVAGIGLPFYLHLLGSAIDRIAEFIVQVPFLARGQSAQQIAGFSSRGEIWDRALTTWSERADVTEQLIGFGYNGHVTSQVVYSYSDLVGGFLNLIEALHIHNTAAQLLYDAGILGLTATAAALFVLHARLAALRHQPLIAFLSVLCLTSVTEVTLAIEFRTSPVILALALAAVVEPGHVTRFRRRQQESTVPKSVPPKTGTGGRS